MMGELAKTAFEYLFKEEIYIVDEHEVVVKVEEPAGDVPVSPTTYLQCRRCGKQGSRPQDFSDEDCHDCDCGYCNV